MATNLGEKSPKLSDISPEFQLKVDNDRKVLIRKRGTVKAKLTSFKKYINSLSDNVLSEVQLTELKFRMSRAKTLLSEFELLQDDINSHFETDTDSESLEEFESDYYTTIARAQCIIGCDNLSENQKYTPSGKLDFIKLPTISIPEFDGSYEHWLEFRDTFQSLIHNSKEITDIQKFHYLKSALKANASLVIDSLQFSADNYTIAWELLMNRYNNSRLLVHNHLKSLFSMPTLTKEIPSQLRKLIDNVLKNLRALKILGEPTEHWDTIIIYLVVSKLDQVTEREWEQHKCSLLSKHNDSNSKLTVENLLQFLKGRAEMLETLNVSHSRNALNFNSQSQDKKKYFTNSQVSQHTPKIQCNIASNKSADSKLKDKKSFNKYLCFMCNSQHPLYSCQQFLNLTLIDRLKLVKEKGLCENCMRLGHSSIECRYGPCRKCEQKHNSLLCDKSTINISESNTVTLLSSRNELNTDELFTNHSSVSESHAHNQANQSNQVNADVHAHTSSSRSNVLLSTALIKIPDRKGIYHDARAVLDSGSERCFITKSLCDKLDAQIIQSTQTINGVGSSVTQCTQSCNIEFKAQIGHFSSRMNCIVLPKITSNLPSITFSRIEFDIPDNVTLADPYFFESLPIDVLIGADLFWNLLSEGKIKLSNGSFLQNTKLGWIVSGLVKPNTKKSHSKNIKCFFTQTLNEPSSLENQLRKFWEIEEVSSCSIKALSDEERACEEHFVNTTTRSENGKFCVRIPFKSSPSTLGETRKTAENRFYALEKRLERNPEYKKMYTDFIHEYIRLGHMTKVHTYGSIHYFMTHHGVFRPLATTTKLRVVFNGAEPSSNGISLNDLQMVGPPIQGDLIAILLRFRENEYVACADIEKMYRCVLVAEDQRDLQLILWRDNPSEPLGVYQLNTVTYGTASAPFLSCRCLKQLADEVDAGSSMKSTQPQHDVDPDVAYTIRENFYVDDLVIGAQNKEKLISLCQGTSQVLNTGCFPLRKWIFNFDLENQMSNSTENSKNLSLGENVPKRTLGLGWYNMSDKLYFHTQIEQNTQNITKRIILSTSSSVYDPYGLLNPILTIAKILMQKCWLLKLEWDQPVPSDIAQIWKKFVENLSLLNSIRIPRFVMCSNPIRIEIHIFTDASQVAYGACAYVRTMNAESAVTVRLLCAKGKVAPIEPMTIPRLELCGAVIGARLYSKIIKSLRSQIDQVVFWSDSTIVLGWLGMPTNLLKTYVQNRVSEIRGLTKDCPWRHVCGKENPADLVSRGMSLDALSTCSLWWQGPQFLHEQSLDTSKIDLDLITPNDLPEIKNTINTLLVDKSDNSALFNFERFSQFNRLKRSAAYVLRFVHNTRNKSSRRTGSLTVDELRESTILLAKMSQQESFSDLHEALARREPVKNAHLSKLNLFIDSQGLIRVGGRIENALTFNYDKKHPILLCAKHNFTKILFRFEHIQTMHAAPQLLLFTIRETWWPVGGRNLARKIVHGCITCSRMRGKLVTPIMGNLPKERLNPGFPFIFCGVDYCGPALILNRKGRGAKTQKAYICLFICFSTRAVHLELVTDLTSDSYLLALKRFISRRGKPSEIYSDNGKNFVGLKNEFKHFLTSCSAEIKEYATSQNIKFNMIPPYASHFGGLWEAGVKSFKHHLKRVVGNAHLTYEEFNTVLAQVEAILNSRPLTPISSDPHDFLPLTPAHFLIGRPLTAPVQADVKDAPAHSITRYQRIEQIKQHFWSRWSKEYVSELQMRGKWKQHGDDLKEGTLILIKDDNLPPLKWSLGRILKTYPGRDGVSRVADIRTADGITRRAFSKICPLPVNED